MWHGVYAASLGGSRLRAQFAWTKRDKPRGNQGKMCPKSAGALDLAPDMPG